MVKKNKRHIYILMFILFVSQYTYASDHNYFSNTTEFRNYLLTIQEELQDKKAPTVWYIPHPDDEAIGMAGAIMSAQNKGKDNIIVLLTRGGYTLSRYLNGLTVQEIKNKRTNEFLKVLSILNISSSNTFIFLHNQNNISIKSILDIMYTVQDVFPGAAHRTTSIHDPHIEHQNAAKSLILLNQKYDKKLDLKFYRVYHYNLLFDLTNLKNSVIKEKVYDQKQKEKGLQVYLDGIAGQSTPKLIKKAIKDPYEYRDKKTPSLDKIKLLYFKLGYSSNNEFNLGLEYGKLVSYYRLSFNYALFSHLDVNINKTIKQLPFYSQLYFGGGFEINNILSPFLKIGLNINRNFHLENKWKNNNNLNFLFGVRLYLF